MHQQEGNNQQNTQSYRIRVRNNNSQHVYTQNDVDGDGEDENEPSEEEGEEGEEEEGEGLDDRNPSDTFLHYITQLTEEIKTMPQNLLTATYSTDNLEDCITAYTHLPSFQQAMDLIDLQKSDKHIHMYEEEETDNCDNWCIYSIPEFGYEVRIPLRGNTPPSWSSPTPSFGVSDAKHTSIF